MSSFCAVSGEDLPASCNSSGLAGILNILHSGFLCLSPARGFPARSLGNEGGSMADTRKWSRNPQFRPAFAEDCARRGS